MIFLHYHLRQIFLLPIFRMQHLHHYQMCIHTLLLHYCIQNQHNENISYARLDYQSYNDMNFYLLSMHALQLHRLL